MTVYPRRVQNLVNKLDSYSDGRNITAAESRDLSLIVAGVVLDLWDEVQGKNSDWGRTAAGWFARYVLPTLISYAVIGSFIWRFLELR